MDQKKQQRRPAILLVIALWFTGCASSPDLRPTVELCRREFQRRIVQAKAGQLGYDSVKDEGQRQALKAGLLKALESHERACALALEGGK